MSNTAGPKQLKAATAKNYGTRQLWIAVLRRTDLYRLEPGGIYQNAGEHFEYFASYDFDRARAIAALIELDAIDLAPAGAYQRVMGG